MYQRLISPVIYAADMFKLSNGLDFFPLVPVNNDNGDTVAFI